MKIDDNKKKAKVLYQKGKFDDAFKIYEQIWKKETSELNALELIKLIMLKIRII
jgi:hypothetical protein